MDAFDAVAMNQEDGSVVLAGEMSLDSKDDDFSVVALDAEGLLLWEFQVKSALSSFSRRISPAMENDDENETWGIESSAREEVYLPLHPSRGVSHTTFGSGIQTSVWCGYTYAYLVQLWSLSIQRSFFLAGSKRGAHHHEQPQSCTFVVDQAGTPQTDACNGIAMAEDGSVVAVGQTWGNWDGVNPNAGGADFAAFRLSASGEEIWRYQVNIFLQSIFPNWLVR